MAKQLNVDLRFNADTSAAKAQLQSLQTSINQLTTSMATQGTQFGITSKIQEAQQAAVQLKTALSQSMNIETGKFDLSKFNSSLKSVNTDLSKLKTQLVNLGPSGQQTFMTLAQSIMTAEIPTKRISASLAALGTTLKNTAKWQLSSTMLHGFMSAVQTSYRYAQDLNQSLNNIRIVTGESAEAMDKFAARANKAAKALSASTLDYTDAALIFYQQGLQGKDVEERAEITLKMANVSRQSAEIVSDQLTAVWNNFANGTESLESFADKMVALGAATASSSDEIASGLEKFVAIGETIGLSFDYAVAALATITSNTRQSEEVVGTALKTIFARIQGLKLGETLEDGTTLNKYSQALETVGVHIYNANGGLKNMDTILDETAAKWNTLTKDQQAALAQTVAGIRQYNQFIALMDNWESKGVGDRDSMKANLETINESTGALQEQADTYAESWEAANKRVKASAEEIYMDLLDDDFFIDLTNGFADFLGLLDSLLDSMGGARGLLTGLSSILLNMFAGSAAKGLENMVYNFRSFVGLTQKEAIGVKQQAFGLASSIGVNTRFNLNTPMQLAMTTGMQNQLQLEQELLNIKDKLTEAEQLQAKYIIEQNNAYSQQAVQVAQQLEIQKEKTRLASQDMREAGLANWDTRTVEEKFSMIKKDIGLNEEIAAELERVNQEFLKAPTTGAEQYIKKIEGLIEKSRSRGMEETATHLEKKIRTDGGKGAYRTAGGLETQARADKNIVDNIRIKQQQDIENKTRNSFSTGKGKNKEQVVDNKTIEKTTKSMTALVQKEQELDKTNKGLAENTEKSSDAIKNLGNSTRSWSQTMVGIAEGAMSLSSAINSLNSLKTTWVDKTIGTGEKLLQTFMSLGMAIPMLINGINGLKTSFLGANSVMLINEIIETRSIQRKLEGATAESILAIAKTATTDAEKAKAIATAFGMGIEEANQLLTKEGILLQGKDLVLKVQELINQKLLNLETSKGVIAKGAYTIATTVQTIAQALFNAQLSITAGLIIGLVAIIGLLALGIWGITKAWQNYQANTPEEQLKAAKEEAKSLNEQLNETRKAAEDLKSGFDDYNQIVEKLANCKKGTQEWTEALKENNDKVLELMEQYPELSAMTQEINGKIESAVSIGPDGELIIADWAYDRLYRAVARSGAISSIAANYGQQDVNSKEIRALENKIEKSPGATYTWTETTTKLTGAQKRTGNYTKSKDTRTGVEKKSGKKYTPTYTVTNTGTVSSEKLNEQAKLLIDTYGSDADKHIDEAIKNLNLKGNTSKVSDTIESLIDSNLELRKAVEENTASEKLKNAAVAGELMSGYSNYDKSEYKGHINQLVGETLDIEDNQERIEYYQNQITNNSSKESAWKDYIKLAGMTEENGYSNLTLGKVTNDEIKYTYIDENDEKQEKVISTGKVAKTLAAEEQYGVSAEYGEHVADYMSTFTSKDQADMFSSLIAQDAGFLSQETLDLSDTKIQNIAESFELTTENAEDLGPILKKAGIIAEDVELDKLTPEQLKKINKEIADTTTKIVKQKQAFEKNKATYQQYIKTLQDINSSSEEQSEAAKGLSKNLGEVFGLKNLKVDPEVLKENAGLIQDFFNNTSEDAGKNLQEALASEIQAATIQDAKVDIIANIEGGEEVKIEISTLLDELSIMVSSADFKVGVAIDPAKNADFINKCNEIIAVAGWTEQEAIKHFKNMNYDVKVKTVEKEPDKTNWTARYPEIDKELTEKSGVVQYTGKTLEVTGTSETGGGSFVALESITPLGSAGGNIDTVNDKIGGKVIDTDGGTINPNDNGKNTPKNKTFKEKDKKEKKLYEDEFDRYYDITQALEEYNRELEETQERKDELWGPDKLAAMEAEKKKLSEITAKQKEYIKAISGADGKGGYLKADIDALKQLDPDAKFDENGRLINYEEITQKWLKELNSTQETWNTGMENATNTFNANKNSENADETYDNTKTILDDDLEKAEDVYEKRKAALDKWKETYDLNEKQKEQLKDYIRQMQQLEYETIMYKVEFKAEVDERALKVIEHKLKRLEDDFFKSAEAMAMIQSKTQYYDEDQFNNISNGVDELKAKFEAGEITQAQYIEGLGQFQDMAIENVDALYEMNDAMKEYYSDTLDAGMQKIKDMTQHFDHLSSRLQHYQSIVNLMGHEQNYDLQNKLLQSQIEVLNDKIETAKSTMTMLQDQLEQAKQNYANATTEEEKENWRQRIVDINNALMEEEDAYLSYVEEVGDTANQILTNSIEKAFKDVEDQMTNNLGFDSILKDMERMNTLTDEFLTNTNKMYETNKMIANAQSEIDKTSNLQAKQKYQDYIKYIEQLQVSGNLTQTELEVAQARYKVLEAEIALEEAKEAKDTVRLTRDAEGNFGYVYTANQDNVDGAQQNYLDAQNELYNVGLETTKEYREKIVNLQQQTLEDLKQLEIDYRVNHLMSEEEYEQQKAAIMETSQETLKTYQEQFNLGQFTMATNSYEGLEGLDSQYYNGVQTTATQTQKTLEDNLAKFNAGVLSAEDAQYFARASKDTKYYTDLKTLSSGIAEDINGIFNTNENSLAHELTVTFYNSLDGALTDCKEATDIWKTNMTELVEAVGLEFDGTETDEGLTQKINNTLTESQNLSDYLNGEDGLIKTIGDELTKVGEATLAWEAHWKEIQLVIAEYDKLIDRTETLLGIEGNKGIDDSNDDKGNNNNNNNNSNQNDNNSPQNIRKETEVEKVSGTYTVKSGDTLSAIAKEVYGDAKKWPDLLVKNGFIEEDERAKYLQGKYNTDPGHWIFTGQVLKYDTGGYTGNWGPEGRLAMLHEKELVLNKQDTENFLTATQILREISDILDHNALAASLGATNLAAMTISSPTDQILQQEVIIHADFPNVTDHNEIEIAIDNLINAASQHAYRQ